MIFVDAEDFQLFFRGGEVGLGIAFRGVSLLNHGLGDGSVLEEILCTEVGLVGELLVVHSFEISVEGAGDVGALDLEEELTFLHVVIEARLDVDDPAVGEGDDGDLARYVRKDGAGGAELGG